MRKTIDRETLKAAVAAHPQFRSVPDVAVPIMTMFNTPATTFRDLAGVIKKSPHLTERVLTVVNSGFYGFRRRVETVDRAVVLLGWNAIKMITLGSTILNQMLSSDQHLYDHSLRTTVIARHLAMEAGFYKVEEIAVEGLLHDIGRIILEECFPKQYIQVKQYILDHGVPVHIAEREVLGLDHGRIGGWTLEEWNLPKNISSTVTWHHDFKPNTYHARKTAVIHIADVLALVSDVRGPAWEKIPELSPEALETLNLTEIEFRDIVHTIMRMRFDSFVL